MYARSASHRRLPAGAGCAGAQRNRTALRPLFQHCEVNSAWLLVELSKLVIMTLGLCYFSHIFCIISYVVKPAASALSG